MTALQPVTPAQPRYHFAPEAAGNTRDMDLDQPAPPNIGIYPTPGGGITVSISWLMLT